MADQVLDAKELNCPLPILKAKKALKDVPIGGTLQVLATDPGAVKDSERSAARPEMTFWNRSRKASNSSS